MPVKIRLARRGRKKSPFYHIVVADARSPRDGKFIENIGSYNPMTSPATIELDQDKAIEWLAKGAQPTETARAILRFRGVWYKKHLMRGVSKGAFSSEKAEEMWGEWIAAKDAKIDARKAVVSADKVAKRLAISGKPGAVQVEVKADEQAATDFLHQTDDSAAQEFLAETVVETATDEIIAPEASETEQSTTEEADKAE